MSTHAVTASDGSPLVAVRDDDEVRRRRIRAVLEEGRLTVVEDREAPDVLVLGGEVRRAADVDALVAAAPEAPRLVLVVSDVARPLLERAVHAGVLGCVAHADVAQRLAATVRAVASGQVVVPRELFTEPPPPVFSQREKQVLGMVVLGFTNAEIAARLHLAESTVKSHLSSSFTKLGVRSRTEASARILDPANRLGLGILAISGGS